MRRPPGAEGTIQRLIAVIAVLSMLIARRVGAVPDHRPARPAAPVPCVARERIDDGDAAASPPSVRETRGPARNRTHVARFFGAASAACGAADGDTLVEVRP